MEYSQTADALYVNFVETNRVARTVEIDNRTLVDPLPDGRVAGIEVLVPAPARAPSTHDGTGDSRSTHSSQSVYKVSRSPSAAWRMFKLWGPLLVCGAARSRCFVFEPAVSTDAAQGVARQ